MTPWKFPQLCNQFFFLHSISNKQTNKQKSSVHSRLLAPSRVQNSTSDNLDLMIQIYAFPHESHFDFLQIFYSIGFPKVLNQYCATLPQNPLLDRNTQPIHLNPAQRQIQFYD